MGSPSVRHQTMYTRPFEPDDLPAVAALLNTCLEHDRVTDNWVREKTVLDPDYDGLLTLCTTDSGELVAFAQHPGRVGRSIPTWGPEERRLSPLENSCRWSASASAPRPVKKLLGLIGSVALAAQALGARSSIHEANHSSSP